MWPGQSRYAIRIDSSSRGNVRLARLLGGNRQYGSEHVVPDLGGDAETEFKVCKGSVSRTLE